MKRIVTICLLILLLLLTTSTVLAQTYYFSVDRLTVDLYWNEDGTLDIVYEFVFTNATGVSPIDFVDVGFPNSSYSLANVTATVDGQPIYDIETSPYVAYGVALGLGSNAIPPGNTGTVWVQVTGINDMLYTDSHDSTYASAVFSPTWFSSEFVYGTTNYTVTYHFPPGLVAEDPRWHGAPEGFSSQPLAGFDDNGRIYYTWNNPSATIDTQYLFGASFPKQYVPETAIQEPSLWERLGISIDIDDLIGNAVCCGVALLFIGIPILSARSARKRKLKYLPPKVAIEGHGIKRGLTAVEAAILMEQPMDKIMTMILFGILKKEAATVVDRDPLKLDVADPLPDGLRSYEVKFLEAFKKDTRTKRRKALQSVMVELIRSVSQKMKGFSHKETKEYYENIMKRAWAQIEAEDVPEVKSEKYEQALEWTMLDEEYDDRTRRVFQHSPVFVPIWWHRYDPGYSRRVASLPSAPSKPSAPTMKSTRSAGPTLPGSDFAVSVVGGLQSFSSGVIGNLTDFTGGITKTTNPPPKPSSSSYRGGGGSSCACACACAGCACACAGGGR
jgi:hypothetical protein